MTPQLATLVFFLGIYGLIYLTKDKDQRFSLGLWIASIWTFLGSSRMVSEWFLGGSELDSPDRYLDGSPVDRLILSGLLFLALSVLLTRSKRVLAVLSQNKLILLFFAYALVSVLWSDFEAVAFKRWTKAFGNLATVMLVLTETDPVAAIRRFFSRVGFFLIPISVLLIKYYPFMGRGYSRWNWQPYFTGASTGKNGLGSICVIFGLTSLWVLFEAVHNKRLFRRNHVLAAHSIMLVMVLWLLQKANSATALACYFMGAAALMVATWSGHLRPRTVHLLAGIVAAAGAAFYLFPDSYDTMVRALGRNPDLTGRTDIWNDLFKLHLEPWLGTGYESFWLGDRAKYFWTKYYFHPNQAHNGYIETYVNLGMVGVSLLALQIIVGYRNIVKAVRMRDPVGPLRFILFMIALIYNVTEAFFKVMHPVWIAFLIAIMAVPALKGEDRSSDDSGRSLDQVPESNEEEKALREFAVSLATRRAIT